MIVLPSLFIGGHSFFDAPDFHKKALFAQAIAFVFRG